MKKLIKKWLGIDGDKENIEKCLSILREILESSQKEKDALNEKLKKIDDELLNAGKIFVDVKTDISSLWTAASETKRDTLDKISRLEKGIFDAVSEIERLSKDNAILK